MLSNIFRDAGVIVVVTATVTATAAATARPPLASPTSVASRREAQRRESTALPASQRGERALIRLRASAPTPRSAGPVAQTGTPAARAVAPPPSPGHPGH